MSKTRFRWSNPHKQGKIKINRTAKGSGLSGGGYADYGTDNPIVRSQPGMPNRPLPINPGGTGVAPSGAPTPHSVSQWIIQNKPKALHEVTNEEITQWVFDNWDAILPYFPQTIRDTGIVVNLANGFRRLNNMNSDQYMQQMMQSPEFANGARFAVQQGQQTRWEIVAWFIVGMLVGWAVKKFL